MCLFGATLGGPQCLCPTYLGICLWVYNYVGFVFALSMTSRALCHGPKKSLFHVLTMTKYLVTHCHHAMEDSIYAWSSQCFPVSGIPNNIWHRPSFSNIAQALGCLGKCKWSRQIFNHLGRAKVSYLWCAVLPFSCGGQCIVHCKGTMEKILIQGILCSTWCFIGHAKHCSGFAIFNKLLRLPVFVILSSHVGPFPVRYVPNPILALVFPLSLHFHGGNGCIKNC